MGVVAPVAAVLTATLPVAFGFLTEGVPDVIAIVGIGFAALSVVLVSRSPDAGDGRPSGILLRARRRDDVRAVLDRRVVPRRSAS